MEVDVMSIIVILGRLWRRQFGLLQQYLDLNAWMLSVGLFILLGLTGCGGGDKGAITPPVEPFDPEAYQQMVAIGNEAATKYTTLLEQGASPEAAAEETVSWAKTQPNIIYAETGSDGTSVWLEFDTGVVQVITQLPPITSTEVPQPRHIPRTRDAAAIAGNNKAIDMNAAWRSPDGKPWPDWDNDYIVKMLESRGYHVDRLKGEQVNVMAFRNLTQYSVVYIDTHGACSGMYGPVFLTREQVTEQKDNSLYADDLRNKRLVHAVAVIEGIEGVYYAITAKYIAQIPGIFPKHSFVFAKACYSFAGDHMARAFQQKGVSAYVGWTGEAYIPGSPLTALWIFDFLTGSYLFGSPNHTDLDPNIGGDNKLPMNLKNAVTAWERERAYWPPVAQPGANLRINGNLNFVLEFAPIPHLHYLLFNDRVNGERGVTLEGSFGTTPGSIQFADWTPITVPEGNWSPSAIFISYRRLEDLLPKTPPVAGEVRVVVNELKSNPLAYYVTSIYTGNSTNGSYWVEIHLRDPEHQANQVIASGPGASSGMPLTFYPSWHGWFVNISLPNPPPANPVYEIKVEGTPQARFSAKAWGYFDAFPKALFPSNGSCIDELTHFSWKPSPVSGARHGIHLYGPTGEVWCNENVTGASIKYTGPGLIENTKYTWMIHASDPDTGNLAADYAVFIYRPKDGCRSDMRGVIGSLLPLPRSIRHLGTVLK